MEVFGLIAIYSVMMLTGLSVLAGGFVFLAKWVVDNSEEPEGH